MRMFQVAFAVLTLAACGSSPAPEAPPPSSKVQASSEATPAETPAAPPSAMPAPASTTAAPSASQTASAPQGTSIGTKNILVVSFFSPGDGTDRAAYERLEASLKTVKNLPPSVSRRWGREGEHDECFDLSAFSPADRKTFVAKVKEAVRSSKKVTVTEDGTCQEGR